MKYYPMLSYTSLNEHIESITGGRSSRTKYKKCYRMPSPGTWFISRGRARDETIEVG